MVRQLAARSTLWLLPIVVVVCALMILPAGAVLGGANASALTPSGGPQGAAAASAIGSPLTPFAPPGHASSASSSPWSSQSSKASASSLTLSSAKNPTQYAQALDKVASGPANAMGGPLSSLAAAIAAGRVSPSSVYLPNLALLHGGAHVPGQQVGVGYTANPAPMGIGDFGLGATPYTYNTSHFEGSLTLNAANGTYPGAYYFITPPAATGGSYNSPYYFGIQLNTVTNNVSIPGNDAAAFWTQNVVTLNGNWITFEDNIWNFSSPSGSLLPGSLYSYGGNAVYPTFYYDYGPSVPLTFPVTLNLYNNVSVVGNRDQVTFGYRVVDSAGAFTGVYDTVVFNSPAAPAQAPPFSPAFQVSGQYTTPLGLDYDSELIFGGPGGGSNAVFNNISGTETLLYSNLTSGGWKSVPSAYDFGADTGETAIGVAETWSPGGVVGLSAGPSLLYGLWNSQPSTAVPSGAIEYQGSLSPSYGFTFVGRAPVPYYYNTSYLPTNANGGFLTYLPPGSYNTFTMADGYASATGAFSATSTGNLVTLSLSPGTLGSPLYLNGNVQAEAAAANLVKWTSGKLNFTGLTLLSGANALFFDRLNDWGFVSFNLFQATGVTDVINVTGMSQGVSFPGANTYYMDGPAIGSPPTLLGIVPAQTNGLPQYGELIAFYSDPHVQVYDQVVLGTFAGSSLDPSGYFALNPAGGAIVMWNTPGAASNITEAVYGSYGVFIAGSPGVSVSNALAAYGANAVTLAGSNGAKVTDVQAFFSVNWTNHEGTVAQTAIGIYDEGSSGGSYSNILAAYGAYGYYGARSSSSTITNVQIEYGSTNITQAFPPTLSTTGFAVGAFLYGTSQMTVVDTIVDPGNTIGVLAVFATGTTISNTVANGAFTQATTVYLYGDDYTNITNLNATDTYLGLVIEGSGNTTLDQVGIFDPYILGFGVSNYDTTFSGFTASETFADGLEWEASTNSVFTNVLANVLATDAINGVDLTTTTITGLTVNDGSAGAYLAASTGTTISSVSVDGSSIGVYLDAMNGVTISGLSATNSSLGVEDRSGSTAVSASHLAADIASAAAEFFGTSQLSVSGVTANDGSLGVEAQSATTVTVSGVAATLTSIGVEIYASTQGSVSGASGSGSSLAVYLETSTRFSITNVTASDTTIGVWLFQDQLVTVSQVTGSGTAAVSPGSLYSLWSVPLALVVTEGTSAVTISFVNATMYPAAIYDDGSNGLTIGSSNATGGYYGIEFNSTYSSVVTGFGAYQDFQGIVMDHSAEVNSVTGSSFVDDSSYGAFLITAYDNTLWNNNFIGDNGATNVYNPLHVQAWSGEYNYFSTCTDYTCSTGVGNYWADWHTYGANGLLAPYLITGNTVDLFPIGPAETFAVTFTESGLTAGSTWSVTMNGVTQSATTSTITFAISMGTYAYTVGNMAGYSPSPASGSVTVSAAAYSVAVTFAPLTYAVTLSEGGLASGTVWSATVNGQTQSTSGATLVFYLPDGTYSYAFGSVSGYNLGTNSSGALTVSGAPMALAASYSATNTPSLATTGDLNNYFAVAIALAVIALIVALLALLLFRRKKPEPVAPPAAWSPPPAAAAGAGESAGGSSGGAASWSEGAGPGSPPSS